MVRYMETQFTGNQAGITIVNLYHICCTLLLFITVQYIAKYCDFNTVPFSC